MSVFKRERRRRKARANGGRARRPAASALASIVLAWGLATGAVAIAAGEGGQTAPTPAGAAPQTLKKAVWGGPTTLNNRSLFPTYRHLGIGIFQMQARWDRIAPDARPADPTDPDDPAYEWPAYLDAAVEEAESHGMKVQLMLMGTPSWANGNLSWRSPPQQPAEFGDFATAISRRYPSVELWMIWGEPNRRPNFAPVTPGPRKGRGPLNEAQALAPRLYAQLLDSAYGALKAADPDDLVIGGNTFTSAGQETIRPYQWISYLKLPDGSRPRLDMWGHNPWGFSKPSLRDRPSPFGTVEFGDLRRLAKKLDSAFPGRRLKLFLSEWGVPIGKKDRDLRYGLRPKQGKQWIRAALRIVRRWDRVYTLGWVHLVDKKRNSTGLLDSSGNRKPGYKTYKTG